MAPIGIMPRSISFRIQMLMQHTVHAATIALPLSVPSLRLRHQHARSRVYVRTNSYATHPRAPSRNH